MTNLELYEAKHEEFLKYADKKNFSYKKLIQMQKTLETLAVEINKENHCYYDNETWITNLNIFHHPTLTGNELTIYVANELNKLNGVMLEKQTINRRNKSQLIINGVSKSFTEWANEYGIRENTIRMRIKYGMSGLDLLQPTKKYGLHNPFKKEGGHH